MIRLRHKGAAGRAINRISPLELPAYVFLSFVVVTAGLGTLFGAFWVLGGGITTVALWSVSLAAGWIRVQGTDALSGVLLPVLYAALTAIFLFVVFSAPEHTNSDPHIHYAHVHFLLEHGFPVCGSGVHSPSGMCSYHFGFDVLAASVAATLGSTSIEASLDTATLLLFHALGLACVAFFRRASVPGWVGAGGILLLFFATGPILLGPLFGDTVPALLPEHYEEGAVYHSVSLMAGRRAALAAPVLLVLLLSLLTDASTPAGDEGGRESRTASIGAGLRLGVLGGAACLFAEETLAPLAIVGLVVLWREGRLNWRRPLLTAAVASGAVALAISAGGFVHRILSRLVSAQNSVTSLVGLAEPGWPACGTWTKPGTRFLLGQSEFWVILALELGPLLFVPLAYLLPRLRAHRSFGLPALVSWALLLGAGLVLTVDGAGYADATSAHRLAVGAQLVALALFPVVFTAFRLDRFALSRVAFLALVLIYLPTNLDTGGFSSLLWSNTQSLIAVLGIPLLASLGWLRGPLRKRLDARRGAKVAIIVAIVLAPFLAPLFRPGLCGFGGEGLVPSLRTEFSGLLEHTDPLFASEDCVVTMLKLDALTAVRFGEMREADPDFLIFRVSTPLSAAESLSGYRLQKLRDLGGLSDKARRLRATDWITEEQRDRLGQGCEGEFWIAKPLGALDSP